MHFASFCKHVYYTVKHFCNVITTRIARLKKIYWKMRDYVYWTVLHLDS